MSGRACRIFSTSLSGMLASMSPKCSMVGTFGISCAPATIWLP
jgi:hypothetical protein